MSQVFEKQKTLELESLMREIKKQELSIQVFLYVIYHYCTTIAVVVLLQENVKLNFCDDSWLQIQLLSHFEGDNRL